MIMKIKELDFCKLKNIIIKNTKNNLLKEDITVVSESHVIIYKKRYIKCKICGDWFITKKYSKNTNPLYCSKKCYAESMRYHKKCLFCGKEIINKHSASLKNRKYCSNECKINSRKGIALSSEWKKALSEGRKKSEKCKGKNLYNWKGGKETEKYRIKQSFYKRKYKLNYPMPIEYLKRLLIVQNNKCYYCGKDLSKYKAVEHLTPVTRGGDNWEFNLVYSCRSCNSKKRQKTLEEFAFEQNRLEWLAKWEYIFMAAL